MKLAKDEHLTYEATSEENTTETTKRKKSKKKNSSNSINAASEPISNGYEGLSEESVTQTKQLLTMQKNEPLLKENPNRFVMFPIQ